MTRLPVSAFACATVVLLASGARAQGVPDPDLDRAHHVLRRITFGPTPDLVQLLRFGTPPTTTPLQQVQAYIAAQLNPPPATTDPNWHGSATVQALVGPGGSLSLPAALGGTIIQAQLVNAQLAYGLDSIWQLREVMAQFWERHFNTAVILQDGYFTPTTGTTADVAWWVEWEANQFYRAHALTTFQELLLFTAKHASMSVYLHMPYNVQGTPNEDFGRELLELYTMSPEMPTATGTVTNYDQSDVEKVARILTGWSTDKVTTAFVYNDADHQYVTQATQLFAVSGSTLQIPAFQPPDGMAEGARLLARLAERAATRDFICRKLIAHFVSESVAAQPTSQLLTTMVSQWGQLGDIKAVLGALFASTEFLDAANHGQRVRVPLEVVLAPPRALGGKIAPFTGTSTPNPLSLTQFVVILEALGQSLNRYAAPIGFPWRNATQYSPSAAMERAKLGIYSLFGPPTATLAHSIDTLVKDALPMPQEQDPTAISHFLLETLYGSRFTASDEVLVANVIGATIFYINFYGLGGVQAFDWNNSQHYWAVANAAAATAMGFGQAGIR